ncbi:MAG: ABC transporter ATP-binding protein [Candidatus Hadarchaeales archaeon]
MEPILEVEGLRAVVDGRAVLKGVDLTVPEGEVHALLGPNASGKSSLAQVLLGMPTFHVVSGTIRFKGKEVTRSPLEERVKMGMALMFQNPPVVRGVKLGDILKILSGRTGSTRIARLTSHLQIGEELLHRDLNYGFSGGERKKAEALQVLAMDPDFLILDEPDSGVDVENLELMGRELSRALEGKSALVITHTSYILKYLKPVQAHVMIEGRVACHGDPEKILETIQAKGYEWCKRCPSAMRS